MDNYLCQPLESQLLKLLNLKMFWNDHWPAPGSEDTELGVLMEPEVDHGEAEVYTRVQA